jgi:hypothetical protein
MRKLSHLATEFVRLPVSGKDSGVPVNPTTSTVKMAFIAPDAQPTAGDWKNADWETDGTIQPPIYSARCLVGPTGGQLTLQPDTKYRVWAKLTGGTVSPEEPVLFSDVLLEVD